MAMKNSVLVFTKRERAALRAALCSMLAGEEGTGDFEQSGTKEGGYSFGDGETALRKLQAKL